MTESLLGGRRKQHLETAGRASQLLLSTTQQGLDASTRASGQTREPSGLILALRVTQQCINRAVAQ